jgi:hypothetical protein
MLHLGPNAPPGQEDAISSGAFRVPFKSGDVDRWGGGLPVLVCVLWPVMFDHAADVQTLTVPQKNPPTLPHPALPNPTHRSEWSRYWAQHAADGVPRPDRALACALVSSFQPKFDTDSVLSRRGAGAPPASATLAALEGALNRTRPLTRFKQAGDGRARAHGIHPLVVQHPMVDDTSTAAAMKFIYATTTQGATRSLWPSIAKATAGGAGAVGPLILSAPQANEAGVLEAVTLALGGQEYFILNAAHGGGIGGAAAGGAAGTGAAAAAAAAAAAGRGVTPEMRALVQRQLPALPPGVMEDLQVCI